MPISAHEAPTPAWAFLVQAYPTVNASEVAVRRTVSGVGGSGRSHVEFPLGFWLSASAARENFR